MSDRTLGEGVYFAADDYAGLLRRVLAAAIDVAILFAAGAALWVLLLALFWGRHSEHVLSGVLLVSLCVFAWLYLTVLKRSSLRTVGYRILGLKIVSTKGGRPSLLAMTVRMLMWTYGPFNLLLDLCWLGADSEQQTLHDCYAGTYVVRSHAIPLGSAPIHLAHYCGGGFIYIYPRVVRPTGLPQPKPV